MITVERFGRIYKTGQRCPACSGERDQGGRLQTKRRKYFFLKCDRCKYIIRSTVDYVKKQERLDERKEEQGYL